MTSDMESLQNALYLDQVPESWTRRAYPSILGLALWFTDLLSRIRELESWTSDFLLPSAVWLAGFFNPQSFLTAIMQSMARRNEWPLDKMCLQCDVTKKNREDFASPPREGAYVYGLFMEGARWDTQVMDIFSPHTSTHRQTDTLSPHFSFSYLHIHTERLTNKHHIHTGTCVLIGTHTKIHTFMTDCWVDLVIYYIIHLQWRESLPSTLFAKG